MATKTIPHKKKQPAHHSPAPWWRTWWPVLVIVGLAVVAGVAYQGFRATAAPLPASATPSVATADGGVVRGSPSARVVVDEYADFQCPYCKRWEQTGGPTVQALIDSGQVRYVYHPIAILGGDSVDAANAALCAGDSGKFWEYHDTLYRYQGAENSGYLTTSRFLAWGSGLGLPSSFSQCVRDGRYRAWVRGVTDKASQNGISSTPTIFVNGKKLSSLDPSLLQQMVQQAGR